MSWRPLAAMRRVRVGRRELMARARESLLWVLLARQKRWIRLWAVLVAVYGATLGLIATTIVRLVDKAIVDQSVPLEGFVGRFVVLGIIAFVFGFLAQQVTRRLSYHVEYELRTWLYSSVHSAELRRLDAVAGGQLVARSLTDIALIEQIIGSTAPVLLLVPAIIGLLLVLLVIAPPMAIIASLTLPLNIWLLGKFKTRLWGLTWAELTQRAEVARAVDEPVRGIRVVKAFGSEERERTRVAAAALKAYRYSMSKARLLARYEIPIRAVPFAVEAVVILIGARIAMSGGLSTGAFLLTFQLTVALAQIAGIVNDLAQGWQFLRSAQSRVGDVLRMGAPSPPDGAPLPEPANGLELQGVGVDYGSGAVLQDFGLTVGRGELVVLVGPPSSGKSTVANVCSGMLVPDVGEVRLDGADVRTLDATAVRRQVRTVSEEPFLFATTLRENLALGAPDHEPDDDQLMRAMWAAGAEDVVADLPDGLDSWVGDRGLTLSGGQRQRLALARALVSPPGVLVLDDALAAVHPSLEVEILGRIRSHAPGAAILCITRRPALAAVADRSVVLPAPPPIEVASVHADGAALAADEGLAGAVAGFGPIDPKLLDVVAGLQLTDEVPRVGDAEIVDKPWPKLTALVRSLRGVMLAGLALALLQALAQAGPSLLFGSISRLIDEGDARQTDLRSMGLLVVAVGVALTAYGFRITGNRFSEGVVYSMRRRVFDRLSRVGVDYYDRELPGEVATRVVNDLDLLQRFLQGPFFYLVRETSSFVVAGGLLVAIAPGAAPAFFLVAGIIALVTAVDIPLSQRAYGLARDALGRLTARFEEDFTGRLEIRRFGVQARQNAKFVDAAWELRGARRRAFTVTNAYGQFMFVFAQVGGGIVLAAAGELALAGTISVGTALTVQLLSQRAITPLGAVAPMFQQGLDTRVSFRRLRQPFGVPVLPAVRPDAVACPRLTGHIVFDGVEFSYPHVGRPILHDVSFAVEAGEVVALVGYTGAGKSSIAKLIARVYDPDAGAVVVDGQDLRDLDLGSYRRRLGVVPQDAFVFKGTVASNIGYGNETATPAEIEAAAKAVGAHEMLAALPGGYEHPVDEEGRNLTAAQRQLVALARAWLVRPEVLVLDEATSTLDARLERRVLEAVSRLGVTTIMVTHRQENLAFVDQVIVLDGGRVAETGRPSELIGAGGAYDALWAADPEAELAPVLAGDA